MDVGGEFNTLGDLLNKGEIVFCGVDDAGTLGGGACLGETTLGDAACGDGVVDETTLGDFAGWGGICDEELESRGNGSTLLSCFANSRSELRTGLPADKVGRVVEGS